MSWLVQKGHSSRGQNSSHPTGNHRAFVYIEAQKPVILGLRRALRPWVKQIMATLP